MNDEKKWPWSIAMPEAEAIVERLAPACERLAIGGSLRRLKPFVGDIEIVFSPKISKRPDGLFDEKIVSAADEVIEQLLKDGYFQKRPNKRGIFTWGESNKLAIHVPSGIPVDLFCEPGEICPCVSMLSLLMSTGNEKNNTKQSPIQSLSELSANIPDKINLCPLCGGVGHWFPDWPRSLAIRTGPKEFNIQLMATAPKNGHQAHAYGEALHKIPSGERVIPRDERDFIEKCGLKYLQPKDR